MSRGLFISTSLAFLVILLSYSIYNTHPSSHPYVTILLSKLFPSIFVIESDVAFRHKKSNCYTMALVTDLDLDSKVEREEKWYSILRFLTLSRASDKEQFQISELYDKPIYSEWNRKRRSMELSAMLHTNEKLYAFCDITGLVYEIDKNPLTASPIYILTAGRNSSFKSEWATIKDNEMIVGSIGKEWVVDEKPGHILYERIQRINMKTGEIKSQNWHDQYWALREAANATWPGYILHEGAVWNQERRKWYFLPRKISHDTIYSEEADETMGSNIMLIANEDFSHVETRRIGPLESEYGFSDLELLYDEVFVAIKVRERAETGTDSKLIVFDASTGELLSEWHDLGRTKFEGITTLSTNCDTGVDW